MKKNIFFINKGLLFAILCLFVNEILAQKKVIENTNKNFIGFSMSPTFYQPFILKQLEGRQHFRNYSPIGFSGNLDLIKDLNSKNTIKVGISVEMIPHYVSFEIEDSMSNYYISLLEQTESLGSDVGNYQNGIYAFGLNAFTYDQLSYNINFSFQTIIKNNCFIELGIKAMYINNSEFNVRMTIENFYQFEDVPNVDTKVFNFNIDHTDSNGEDYRWLPSFSAAIGLTNKFKIKRELLEAKLFINYVPKLISTGTYEFLELSKPNYGTINHRINNIGLSFTFGIPVSKKID